MDDFAKQEMIEMLNWLTSEKSKYAILYGNQTVRFATKTKELTPEQLVGIYLKQKS